jgi:hypothetical protein
MTIELGARPPIRTVAFGDVESDSAGFPSLTTRALRDVTAWPPVSRGAQMTNERLRPEWWVASSSGAPGTEAAMTDAAAARVFDAPIAVSACTVTE